MNAALECRIIQWYAYPLRSILDYYVKDDTLHFNHILIDLFRSILVMYEDPILKTFHTVQIRLDPTVCAQVFNNVSADIVVLGQTV